MFRNKVVVRAQTPFSPNSPFLFRQIHLDLPPSSSSSSSSSSSPLSLKIDALCWKLSRTLPLACFQHSPATLFLVYQGSQSPVTREAVGAIQRELPVTNVEEEEELCSGLLAAKSVECSLKSLLLNSGWRCLGESCFVHSNFSSGEERKNLLALNVSVQSDIDGSFVFLVSPDVVRFSRFEAANLVSSKSWNRFDNGKEIALKDCNIATCCSILPSLFEGHVIGACKLPPGGDLQQFEEVWSIKHGLEAHGDYFIKIHFTHGGCTGTQWYPSTFVLQGAGFSPAPQSTRISECVQVLQSFMRIIEAWNFFSQGRLKIKSISSLTIGSNLSTWIETANNCQGAMANANCSSNKGTAVDKLFSVKDFRTPCFASNCDTVVRNQESEMPDNKVSSCTTILPISGTCDHVSKITSSQAKHCGPGRTSHSVSVSEGITTETDQQKTHKVIGDAKLKATRKRMKPQADVLSITVEIGKDSVGNVEGVAAGRKCLSEIDMNRQREVKGYTKAQQRTSKKEDIVNTIPQNTASLKEGTMQNSTSPRQEAVKAIKRRMVSSEEEAVKNVKWKKFSPKEKTVKNIKQKRALPKEENAVDAQKNMSKRKKPPSDLSDIITKVIDHHERRQLDLLTVVELKAFLASKQAKVGGKKQDLIQRITALL